MSMVSVTVGNSIDDKTVVVDSSMTPAQILSENNVPTSGAVLYLNGSVMSDREKDQTLDDLKITDKAMIFAVIKTSNG